MELDELLASSDFISLHLPRSPATVNFLSQRELSIVKPGAFLINVSQPNLVERNALRGASNPAALPVLASTLSMKNRAMPTIL